jgi:GcrA cell cycle regulator
MAPRHDNTFWNLVALQTLHQRWHAGESAGQIAEHLGCSRDAVCSKLKRPGLHRAHAPPTAHPVIVTPPKRPAPPPCQHKLPLRVIRRPPTHPPPAPSKTELRAMLAEAVRNTG